MSTSSQRQVMRWHVENGGHPKRLAGHALRLLCEAVELCVAAGASAEEISARVGGELVKAALKGELNEPVSFAAVREEICDVQLLADVIAGHTGNVDTESEKLRKIQVLDERKWEADPDGVLWRPGLVPKYGVMA